MACLFLAFQNCISDDVCLASVGRLFQAVEPLSQNPFCPLVVFFL